MTTITFVPTPEAAWTPDAFFAWLGSLGVDEPAGRPLSSGACPVATWLRATEGEDARWGVTYAGVCRYEPGRVVRWSWTPDWITAVARAVDAVAHEEHFAHVRAGGPSAAFTLSPYSALRVDAIARRTLGRRVGAVGEEPEPHPEWDALFRRRAAEVGA